MYIKIIESFSTCGQSMWHQVTFVGHYHYQCGCGCDVLVGEIREKDVMVQQSCDAKMKSMIQLSELLSKTRLMPVSHSLSFSLL